MEVLLLIIGLIVGIALGWLVSKVMARNNPEVNEGILHLKQEREQLLQQYHELDKKHSVLLEGQSVLTRELDENRDILTEERNQNRHLVADLSEYRTRHQHLEEKLSNQKNEMEELQKKFTTEFENVANAILEKKTATFTEKNKENMDIVLGPLKERIKEFENRIEKNYTEETKERISLKTEIKHLMDLNKQLSDDANNLASALKGEAKTQGNWGELRLEMVLERAGLIRDTHYRVQPTYRDEEGSIKRPDFIVDLPENKHLIVDSKVSLKAYDLFHSAGSEEEQALHIKSHLISIRNHITELSEKRYDSLYEINTPDFVLMYIPIEPAYFLALHSDNDLQDFAFRKDILLVTTSTLLATMRTISYTWRQEDQKKNVLKIVDEGSKLYDKFVDFTEDLLALGRQMKQAKGSYEKAMIKLSDGNGNLVRRTEILKDLGLKNKKRISQKLVDRSQDDHFLPSKESDSEEIESEETIEET